MINDGHHVPVTSTDISYDAIRRCYPNMGVDTARFKELVSTVNRKIYPLIAEMIWETILEGHEFIFPHMKTSYILVEGKTTSDAYRRKFYRDRAVFVEMREYPDLYNVQTKRLRGRVHPSKIELINQRMRDGKRYTKRSSKYMAKKHKK